GVGARWGGVGAGGRVGGGGGGGGWMGGSVANGIATTAEAVRKELLRIAKRMPNSPLHDTAADDVALADGKLVSKRDPSRAVSITDAMRHGGVERIEQEEETSFPAYAEPAP